MTGLIPVAKNSNSYYTAGVRRYFVPAADATALFIGDPVTLAGSADTSGKYQTVTRATLAAGNQLVGAVVAVQVVSDELKTTIANLDRTYRPASTAAYVWVADDPDQEFIIGEDEVGAALVAVDMGNLGILVAGGGGSTVYGRSSHVLDSSSFPAGTATGQFLLLGLVDRADFALGGDGQLFRVKINGAMHELVTPPTAQP